MQCPALREMCNLLTAGKTARDNERVCGSGAYFRQEYALAASARYLILLRLEAERTCQAAAAAIQHPQIESHFVQKRFLVAEIEHRFVVTVSVQERATIKLWHGEVFRLLHQEFAQQKCLL